MGCGAWETGCPGVLLLVSDGLAADPADVHGDGVVAAAPCYVVLVAGGGAVAVDGAAV